MEYDYRAWALYDKIDSEGEYMIEIYDGRTERKVNEIDFIKNLSQEQLNKVAVGPQDKLLDLIKYFNDVFRHQGIESQIDVTNKWSWKRGSYDIMKNYLTNKLELNKKAMSMSKIIERAQHNASFLGYMRKKTYQLESERRKLINMGIPRDVDTDKFQSMCIDMAEKIENACNNANNIIENVNLKPWIGLNNCDEIILYLDIMLTGLNMSIVQDSTVIETNKLKPIRIMVNVDFRKLLNNQRYDLNFKGKYIDDYHMFPYLNSETYYRNWGNVCLDRHHDDFRRAFKKLDFVSMSMILIQWAQYYNVGHSNPYSQPFLTHYGMPKDKSQSYKQLFVAGTVQSACQTTQKKMTQDSSGIDRLVSSKKLCQDIECQYIGNCEFYEIYNRKINLYNKHRYLGDAIYMELANYVTNNDFDQQTISNMFETITGQYISYTTDEGVLSKEEYLNSWYDKFMIYFATTYEKNANAYLYDYLVNNGLLEKAEIKTENIDTDNIKQQMMAWAASEGVR
tara:strand:- start:6922 stop:8448 length:1527 start_codon:yes stop_codon:yes gene_type:complete